MLAPQPAALERPEREAISLLGAAQHGHQGHREPSAGEVEQRVQIRHAVPHVGFEAGGAAGAQDHRRVGGALPRRGPALLGELAQRERAASPSEGMPGRQGNHELVEAELVALQDRVARTRRVLVLLGHHEIEPARVQ